MGSRIEKNDVYEIISKNIRRYRKAEKLTQEELAMKANYTHQFIRRIEAPNIKKSFSLETVYCLAKALNREFNEMFIEFEEDEENEEEY